MAQPIVVCESQDPRRQALRARLGSGRLDRFPHRAVRFEIGEGMVRVQAPTPFHREWLRTRFGREIEATVRDACGESMRVEWGVAEPADGAADPAPAPAPMPGPASAARRGEAPPPLRLTRPPVEVERASAFAEFEVGEANRLAAASARALALEPAIGFDVLTLHGGCGVGKSHLLRGIADEAARRAGARRVRHVSSERFVDDFVSCKRGDRMDDFRRRYRRLAMLCLDDLDDLEGKNATQQELVHTLDALRGAGGRFAASARRHPRLAERLHPTLVSRLEGGMVVDLAPPDAETRERIVERLAARRGLRLASGAARAAASRTPGGVRELEGALARIEACGRLLREWGDGEVDEQMVRRALGMDAASAPARRPRRFEPIAEAVCDRLGVELSEVLGPGRHARVVLARGLICVVARELTTLSYPEMARRLNRRNHSTVITARQRTVKQIEAAAPCPAVPGLEGLTVATLYQEIRRTLCGGG